MKLSQANSCDVLVIGSGLAGVTAAINTAENGCKVILLSGGKTFSGSSFFPGTWGLGLVGPTGEADMQDMADTIQKVGCGMADDTLVRTFVQGIPVAVRQLEEMGVQLKRATNPNQKEFIPCFDHKHRAWYGLLADSMRNIFAKKLDALGVQCLPYCEVIELVQQNGFVNGAVICDGQNLALLSAKAVVLASGGFGGLFERKLTCGDVGGVGHALAVQAGASLVNLEFMQMMPGYLAPQAGIVFNEKTFRYASLQGQNGQSVLASYPNEQELLIMRGGYGPFTSRLASRVVDLAIDTTCAAQPQGVQVQYSPQLWQKTPEFAKVYFDWMRKKTKIIPEKPAKIALYAHAANGGVLITPEASTGVLGLYACGEVTGGMHGADRIGGLSTANGLVFGGIAGKSAAAFAKNYGEAPVQKYEIECQYANAVPAVQKQLRKVMAGAAMVARSETGLVAAQNALAGLQNGLALRTDGSAVQVAQYKQLHAQFKLANWILAAQRLRKESRGSHYRVDYPEENPDLQKRIIVRAGQKAVATFELDVQKMENI